MRNPDNKRIQKEAASKVKIRPPFSFAGSVEPQLGIFKDLKRVLPLG
jgi:hypothetical protein